MTLQELQTFSAVIEEDIFQVLSLEGSIAARNHPGGTATQQVRSAIAVVRERLASRQI
jgi:argininosuccinate lyase